MQARIVKRDEKIVTLKTEKDKFLKVPKKNIDFDFKVGDWVTIEKNEDEIYILPQDSSDFWGEKDNGDYQEADSSAAASLVFNSLAIVASFLNLWNFYAGLVWVGLAVFGLIFGLLSKAKKSGIYKAARIAMWISLAFYLIILVMVICTAIGPAMNGSKGLFQ